VTLWSGIQDSMLCLGYSTAIQHSYCITYCEGTIKKHGQVLQIDTDYDAETKSETTL